MSNKKLETEEKTSITSFNPNSGTISAQKHSELDQSLGDKENLNSLNKNSSGIKQPFKPKSIGHYILGDTTSFNVNLIIILYRKNYWRRNIRKSQTSNPYFYR